MKRWGRKGQDTERTARLLEHGADIAGPGVGAAVALLGGPPAALGGTVLGVLVRKVLLRLGAEWEQRHLGPREKARVAGALYYALDELDDLLREGRKPRDDGFFDPDRYNERARADELLEAVLASAQRDHEERKVKHLGWLYSSFVFEEDIRPGDANYLVDLATRLTYHELTLLALFHGELGYRGVPGWERLHPFEWRAHVLAGELFQLAQQGLLTRTDRWPIQTPEDVSPAYLWVSPTGCKLCHLMRLDRIDREQTNTVYEELKAGVELPVPHELIEKLEGAVDSEPLSEDDLGNGCVRVRVGQRTRSLLPPVGERVHGHLRGRSVTFQLRHSRSNSELAELNCTDADLEEFQALLGLEEGRILRVAPLPNGALALD